MKVKLCFEASEKLLKQHVIDTGNRLAGRFVVIELSELPDFQRAIVVDCAIDYRDEVGIPGAVTGVDLVGYNAPRFETAAAPKFDTIPTVDEWLAAATQAIASKKQWQNVLNNAVKAKADKEAAEKQRQGELHAQYKILQAEWLPKIDAMTEEEANQPLPDLIRAMEAEMKSFFGPKLSDAKSNRWKELRDARLDAEDDQAKEGFVNSHGSDQLKRAIARGHDCKRLYTCERATVEAPGWVVDIEDDAEWKSRSCPSPDALNAADEAEKLNIGKVEIVWLTAEPSDTKQSGEQQYYDGPGFEQCEALVILGYLGEYNLVKVL